MTTRPPIRNLADKDQALAALREARAHLTIQQKELCGLLRMLSETLNRIDRDIERTARIERQVAAIQFDDVNR